VRAPTAQAPSRSVPPSAWQGKAPARGRTSDACCREERSKCKGPSGSRAGGVRGYWRRGGSGSSAPASVREVEAACPGARAAFPDVAAGCKGAPGECSRAAQGQWVRDPAVPLAAGLPAREDGWTAGRNFFPEASPFLFHDWLTRSSNGRGQCRRDRPRLYPICACPRPDTQSDTNLLPSVENPTHWICNKQKNIV
jgi:hypothetical protein